MADRDVAPSRQEGRLPTIMGRNLEGHDVALPSDLAGRPVVLLVAFRMWQQRDVDRWVTELAPLADAGLTVVEVPVISWSWTRLRRFIDGGMAKSIPDRGVRERTITVYDDVGSVSKKLGIGTTSRVTAVLLDAGGRIAARSDARPGSEDALTFVGLVGNVVCRRADPESESDGSV
ncbi:MAG: hypothetical protein DYH08_09005 [Actinobacteria bacterium ATB1]|nr:hypothetical protein [Actinobacteria bacterium ATB1]